MTPIEFIERIVIVSFFSLACGVFVCFSVTGGPHEAPVNAQVLFASIGAFFGACIGYRVWVFWRDWTRG